jgi:hypothetical protein
MSKLQSFIRCPSAMSYLSVSVYFKSDPTAIKRWEWGSLKRFSRLSYMHEINSNLRRRSLSFLSLVLWHIQIRILIEPNICGQDKERDKGDVPFMMSRSWDRFMIFFFFSSCFLLLLLKMGIIVFSALLYTFTSSPCGLSGKLFDK